jgi:hypothetical protein
MYLVTLLPSTSVVSLTLTSQDSIQHCGGCILELNSSPPEAELKHIGTIGKHREAHRTMFT